MKHHTLGDLTPPLTTQRHEPDTPTGRTVSEAREALGYIPPEDFPEFSDDLARLIAAVRTEERKATLAEVRKVVEGMERHRPFIQQTTERGPQPYLAVDDDHPEACEWINREWTLAALRGMEEGSPVAVGLVESPAPVTIEPDAT